MRHLAAHLPFTRVGALAAQGALALLPVGSTEAHGPHLPLSVDVVIAEEVCRRTALRWARDVVQFPSVAYAVTDFAAPFPGTVTVPAEAARAVLEGVLSSIARAGFDTVGLVNHHLEPVHFRLLHEAAGQVMASSSCRVVVVDHRRPPTGPALGDEFMRGGAHAGRYETSLVLAAAPHLVDEEARRGLAEVAVDLPAAVRAGARTFLDCGGARAYLGAPALASAEEGHRLFELLADATVAALLSPTAGAPFANSAPRGE